MAYRLKITHSNGYRCSCCRHKQDREEWFDKLADALANFPKEFPKETDFGGDCAWEITDGSDGTIVASSEITCPPNYKRGDAYKFTRWVLDTPDTFTEQIIIGRNIETEFAPLQSLQLVTDRKWSEILEELRNKKTT